MKPSILTSLFALSVFLALPIYAQPDPECEALDWSSPRETTPYITLSGVAVGCAPDNDSNMTIGITVEGNNYTATNIEPLNKFAIAMPLRTQDQSYSYWAEDQGGRGPSASRPFHFYPSPPFFISQ